MFLLYFRSENKRKTRYVPKTLTPEWSQTVIYRNIHPIELGAKILEITVWDFDRFTFNDFMGQVCSFSLCLFEGNLMGEMAYYTISY